MSCQPDFTKYQTLGNDYIVIDPERSAFRPTEENIRLVCDRRFGLGGDGLLYGPLPTTDDERGWRLRIFNPDGTECERSGNGLRIFARYLRESGRTDADSLCLYSAAGPSQVQLIDTACDVVRIQLGPASLESGAVGAAGPDSAMLRVPLLAAGGSWTATCVHNGNPHCVVPLDETRVTPELARSLGPALRDHELFPRRINVELLHVVDRENIRIEIFERGAGYTLASGSAACAAASAAHALGLTGPMTTVHMPGGQVEVEIDADGGVSLTGEVRAVLAGHWAPRLRLRLSGGTA